MRSSTHKIVLVAGVVVLSGSLAKADIVFQEKFDSGSATYTVSDPYWTSTAGNPYNATIIKTTAGIPLFGVNSITNDASGNGYFLFEPTDGTYPSPVTSASGEFYISPTIAVVADSIYTLSFDMTNADYSAIASVVASIDDSNAPAVSAAGCFNGAGDHCPFQDGWQTFSFTWNSGANTTAQIVLNDLTHTSGGNDFGVDDITLSGPPPSPPPPPVPEPGSAVLLTAGLAGLAVSRRRRHKS
jgi:hypothetical protein